ncbi:MAG: hypothetical protein KC441_06240 [Anaerolineales bacterium]|nr:hypothetical protein [Anaerolineales bacterium]
MENSQQPSKGLQSSPNKTNIKPYEAPAVIYEGLITTRAGTPTGSGASSDNAVDPADLFGN